MANDQRKATIHSRAGTDSQPSPSSRASDATDTSGTTDPSGEERYLRIDEVARRTNMTKRTLRYYEELNLLEPSQRSEGNYRLYSESDVRILEHIKAMRDLLGLELKEIRELVAAELERSRIKERWRTDTDPTWRLSALDDVERVAHLELALLQERLAGLEGMRQTLQERLANYARLRDELRTQLKASHDAPKGQPSEESATERQ